MKQISKSKLISKKTKKTKNQLLTIVNHDPMMRQYIETMLWSTIDINDKSECCLDENYSADDLTKSALIDCINDCWQFIDYCHAACPEALELYLDQYNYSNFGHDFWLTREHHGAGFWDRNYDNCSNCNGVNVGKALTNVGKALTAAAHSFGGVNVQAWKGKVHIQ